MTGRDPNETGPAVNDIDPSAVGQRGVPYRDRRGRRLRRSDDEERRRGPEGCADLPVVDGHAIPGAPRLRRSSPSPPRGGATSPSARRTKRGASSSGHAVRPFERTAELDVRGHEHHTVLPPIQLDDDVTPASRALPTRRPGHRRARALQRPGHRAGRTTRRLALPDEAAGRGQQRGRRASCRPATCSTPATTRSTTSVDGSTCSTDTGSSSPIGRTCSATWAERGRRDRGGRRRSRRPGCPTADVPQTIAGSAGAAVTSMRVLAELEAEAVEAAFAPLVDGYVAWLGRAGRDRRDAPGSPAGDRRRGDRRGREVADRLRERRRSSATTDGQMRSQRFRFMNRAMRDQRIRTQVAAKRAADDDAVDRRRPLAEVEADRRRGRVVAPVPARVHPAPAARADRPDAPAAAAATPPTSSCCSSRPVAARPRPTSAWRPTPSRSAGSRARRHRRRDARRRRRRRRAHALHAAPAHLAAVPARRCAGLRRRADPPGRPGHLGEQAVPHRPVGRAAASAPSASPRPPEQVQAVRRPTTSGARTASPSSSSSAARGAAPRSTPSATSTRSRRPQRIDVYCGDRHGECPFSIDGDADGRAADPHRRRGDLPPPADASCSPPSTSSRGCAREGEAASLFGYVAERCPRHGYRHPDARGTPARRPVAQQPRARAASPTQP